MSVTVLHGDMLGVLQTLSAESFHACVTDPPYHLTTGKRGGSGAASVNPNSPAGRSMIGTGFMGKAWDGGDLAKRPETWAEVYRVMKPGGHLLAFGGTRTSHRMVCAIEDAGFEIRDSVLWLYGQGFPKSHDIAKAIDKHFGRVGDVIPAGVPQARMIPGADQNGTGSWIKDNGLTYQPSEYRPATDEAAQWDGWGSALKPAHEPIVVARKPLIGTLAASVLLHGCGGLNIDGCRVEGGERPWREACRNEESDEQRKAYGKGLAGSMAVDDTTLGRFPANVIHDGSDEVMEAFAAFGEKVSGGITHQPKRSGFSGFDPNRDNGTHVQREPDTGTAARFFYCAKASKADRAGSKHPTVKPLALMSWLVRLVTPPGGTVLDPFAGSGTTGEAARLIGCSATLIEQDAVSIADIHRRLGRAAGLDTPLFAEIAAQ